MRFGKWKPISSAHLGPLLQSGCGGLDHAKLVGFESNPLTALSDRELSEILEFLDKEIAKSKESPATNGLIIQQGISAQFSEIQSGETPRMAPRSP